MTGLIHIYMSAAQNICTQTCTGEVYIMTAFVIHVSYKSVLCGGICTIESCLTLRMIKTQQNRSLNLNDNSVTSTITVHAAVNLVRGKAGNCPLPINYHSHVTCNLSMPIIYNSLIQHSMKYLFVYNDNYYLRTQPENNLKLQACIHAVRVTVTTYIYPLSRVPSYSITCLS